MPFLNERKQELDEMFGVPKKAQILVGGDELFAVDEAFVYTVGRFLITVGFFEETSRYACFAKEQRDDPVFDDRDIEVCLALISPESRWTASARDSEAEEKPGEIEPTESSWVISQYTTTIRASHGRKIKLIASHRTFKPYLLAYVVMPPPAAGEKLAKLAHEMNAATNVEKKLDSIIAVLNELLAERKAAQEKKHE